MTSYLPKEGFYLPPSSNTLLRSLDKALYDDYLCLVAPNKRQIKW